MIDRHLPAGARTDRSHRRSWITVRRHPKALVGSVATGLLLSLALLASMLSPHDPLAIYPGQNLAPPNREFPLGTDRFGRDLFSRLLHGLRASLWIAGLSVGVAAGTGSALGTIAGYYGRHLDAVTMRLMDIVFSFPAVLLALGLVTMLGPAVINIVAAIGIVYMPSFARIVRGAMLKVMQEEFIQAARAAGATDSRIMLRHCLPNILAPLIVQITLSIGFAVILESSLSYLGLGSPPPAPSLGRMILDGRHDMSDHIRLVLWPSLGLMALIASVNLLGDGLRDMLDPRLRSR